MCSSGSYILANRGSQIRSQFDFYLEFAFGIAAEIFALAFFNWIPSRMRCVERSRNPDERSSHRVIRGELVVIENVAFDGFVHIKYSRDDIQYKRFLFVAPLGVQSLFDDTGLPHFVVAMKHLNIGIARNLFAPKILVFGHQVSSFQNGHSHLQIFGLVFDFCLLKSNISPQEIADTDSGDLLQDKTYEPKLIFFTEFVTRRKVGGCQKANS